MKVPLNIWLWTKKISSNSLLSLFECLYSFWSPFVSFQMRYDVTETDEMIYSRLQTKFLGNLKLERGRWTWAVFAVVRRFCWFWEVLQSCGDKTFVIKCLHETFLSLWNDCSLRKDGLRWGDNFFKHWGDLDLSMTDFVAIFWELAFKLKWVKI